MKSIKTVTGFAQLRTQMHELSAGPASRPAPDQVPLPPQKEEQFKKLLQLTKQYRQYEEAWFEKIRRNEFAVNEKDRMMDTRRKLDYLISTIKL